MNEAEIQSNRLFDFLDILRTAHNYTIGPDQYLASYSILIKNNIDLDDHKKLKSLLAPIVCSSPAQQRTFRTLFNRHWRQKKWPEMARRPKSILNKNEQSSVDKALLAQEVFNYTAIILTIISCAVFGFLLVEWLGISEEEALENSKVIEGVEQAEAIGVEKAEAIGEGFLGSDESDSNPKPESRDRNEEREKPEPSASFWTSPAAAAIGLVAIAVLSLIFYFVSSKSIRRLKSRGQSRTWRIDVERIINLIIDPTAYRRSGRLFREHRYVDREELDILASAEASARSAGVFEPVFRVAREQPEYTCLIERVGNEDQQAQLFQEILNRHQINHRLYYFTDDPRFCTTQHDKQLKRLSELANSYPDDRLLVFADARRFAHTDRTWLQKALEICAVWEDRMLATPRPIAEWGHAEHNLARHGFQVVDISEAAMASVNFARGHNAGSPIDIARAETENLVGPFPPALTSEELRWLEDTPPPPEELNLLFEQLQAYLGPDGMCWLSACAVFPATRFDLTVYLGLRLTDTALQPIGSLPRLAALVRLPWMRRGSLPDWLRDRLIHRLSKARREEVRQIVWDWLRPRQKGKPGATGALYVAEQSTRRMVLSRLHRTADENSPVRETLFYGFMVPGFTNALLSFKLSRDFGRPGLGAIGRVMRAVLSPMWIIFLAAALVFGFGLLPPGIDIWGIPLGFIEEWFQQIWIVRSWIVALLTTVLCLSILDWWVRLLGDEKAMPDRWVKRSQMPSEWKGIERIKKAVSRLNYDLLLAACVTVDAILVLVVPNAIGVPQFSPFLLYPLALLIVFLRSTSHSLSETA